MGGEIVRRDAGGTCIGRGGASGADQDKAGKPSHHEAMLAKVAALLRDSRRSPPGRALDINTKAHVRMTRTRTRRAGETPATRRRPCARPTEDGFPNSPCRLAESYLGSGARPD